MKGSRQNGTESLLPRNYAAMTNSRSCMRPAKVHSQLSALLWAVGRKRPPLCRGCAPATPHYKTIPHRPCVRIPAVPHQQRGCCQPNTQSDCPNGGKDNGLGKTGTVYGLVVTLAPGRLPKYVAVQVPIAKLSIRIIRLQQVPERSHFRISRLHLRRRDRE